MTQSPYPVLADPSAVGAYPAVVKAGGGLVWDAVLEYRVWLHPERGAADVDGGNYFRAFGSYEEAAEFAAQRQSGGTLPLVLQEEYVGCRMTPSTGADAMFIGMSDAQRRSFDPNSPGAQRLLVAARAALNPPV
jgi:hypothetical protein